MNADVLVRSRCIVLVTVLSSLLAACGGGSTDAVSVRLVDRFKPDLVQGSPARVKEVEPVAWNFGDPPPEGLKEARPTHGWKAAGGVTGLRVRDGRLVGRTTNAESLIYVRLEDPVPNPDALHGVELRLRVSKGSNLSIAGFPAATPMRQVLDRAKAFPLAMTSPLIAGDNPQTLTLRMPRAQTMTKAQTLVLRPTDAAGADFEIESVRVISQGEHLARIPSGAGWHGLSGIYRETIVSRAPETFQIEADIPGNPWLDLHVGSVEDGPVTFVLRASAPGSDAAEGELLLRRTVTLPHRWEPARVDLSAYAGRRVALAFSLDVEREGSIGFWGSPVVRGSGRPSPAANKPPSARLGSAEPPRGVILMMADTLRKDHLDAYGYARETAPVLTRLAKEGALFQDNVSQATWTKVSAPSIMTSLYPISHRVRDFPDRLPAAAQTLAEVYRDAGYATVSFSSVLFTGKFTNLHEGFEELHESGFLSGQEYPSKTARDYVTRLCDWLEAHRDVPFFVFLHVFDPHDPFEPYRPYDALWADRSKKEAHEAEVSQLRGVIEDPIMKMFGMPNRAEFKKAGIDPEHYINHDIDWYDGSIRAMDAEIGRLTERLRSLGLLDKTVLAFISDHGEEFLDHGRMFHGQTVYGELTGVPLMLYGPGHIPGGLSIGETVRSIDLMPTLLDLSHLPAPEGLQGQSLVPLMAAARDSAKEDVTSLVGAAENLGWTNAPAFSEKAFTVSTSAPPPHDTESYSITHNGWKLIHNVQRSGGMAEFELYDHGKDPLDLTDLAGQHPEKVKKMAARIKSWREMAESQALPEADSTEGLSDEELQRLRSLGYIQ